MSGSKNILILLPLFLLLIMNTAGFTQEDNASAQVDTTKITVPGGDIILDEILIEGIIEKPNVSILPTRKESAFAEIDFIDRSFKQELASGPKKLMMINVDFDRVVKIRNLNEILLKVKK